MSLQRVFKDAYVTYLRNNVHVEDYIGERFPYDESMVKVLAGVNHPETLSSQLDSTPTTEAELRNAILLYESYPTLTPLVASSDSFWIYLTHVDLFNFVQKRWPIEEYKGDKVSFIKDHWHRSPNGAIRTTFMGLWWSVYCSVDENREDKYELTRILFKSNDFRMIRIGPSSLLRCREAMVGILEFLKENPEIYQEYFRTRSMYIVEYFNRLGGSKQLSALDRAFFKQTLERKKDIILSLKKDEEVAYNDRLFSL